LGEGRLNAVVGYQQNRRQEFEEPDEAELDFRLHTVNYDVRYISPELTGRWKLSTGINGMWQQSQNLGEEALIPAYRLLDAGVFATVTRSWDRWNLSGGVRFDHRWLTADDREEQFRHFRKNMNGLSGSVGATYCLTDQMHLRLNLARGFRAPNLSELGSNGVHEGSLRYELGNQQLKPEDSWQLDAGIDYSTHIVTAQLSLFVNHISNFIFLQRMDEGERLKDERLEMNDEGFPVYQYAAGTARLWGGEATVVVHPMRRLHIENTFAYVATRLLHQPDDSRYLPTTPQPRWTATIKCDLLRQCRHLSNSYASIGLECYLRQHRIFAANDTETPSPSYTLLNAAAGTDVMHHGRRLLSVFLTANNLLDRAYQNHLSRLKYADVNSVTGRRGVSNMGRNIGIKVVVPIAF
jgi:iron complex outermembrane receptor protein